MFKNIKILKRRFLLLSLIFIFYFCGLNLKAYEVRFLANAAYLEAYKNLPKVLSDDDVNKYYNIYNYYKQGKVDSASKEIEKLEDRILLGYMEYIKYIDNANYNPSYKELNNWLDNYYDLAVASTVKEEVKNKIPKGVNLTLKNTNMFLGRFVPMHLVTNSVFKDLVIDPESLKKDKKKPDIQNNSTTRQIREAIRSDKTLLARRILLNPKTKNLMNEDTYDYWLSTLSKAYFLNGRDERAIEIGLIALKRDRNIFMETNFYVGLAYYRQGNYLDANKMFLYIKNNVNNADESEASRGAYWYAKTSLTLGDIDEYYSGLLEAFKYPYNFYGILASEELGITPKYIWKYVNFPQSNIEYLKNNERGRRALALLQLGFYSWAEQELAFLAMYDTENMNENEITLLMEALVDISQTVNMPALAYRLAGRDGKYYGLSHLSYPIFFFADIEYKVDPALILAITRRESNFYSLAQSKVGATGLMQLMPSTAKYLIDYYKLDYDMYSIRNPKVNVDLGQRELYLLLNNPNSQGNLIYAIAGYNAGFSKVLKWKKEKYRRADEDQLFFIESIPYYETRGYVKSVLTDYWIYRYKIGYDVYSVHDIIESRPPIYKDVDKDHIEKAIKFTYIESAKT